MATQVNQLCKSIIPKRIRRLHARWKIRANNKKEKEEEKEEYNELQQQQEREGKENKLSNNIYLIVIFHELNVKKKILNRKIVKKRAVVVFFILCKLIWNFCRCKPVIHSIPICGQLSAMSDYMPGHWDEHLKSRKDSRFLKYLVTLSICDKLRM